MGTESQELRVVITADDKAEPVLKKSKGHLIDLGQIAGGVLKIGLGAATAAVGTLAVGLVSSTRAAMDAETVQADLNAVLKSTNFAAGMTADELNQLASSLQDVTRFEDDTTLRGEAMLLTFTNIGKNVFPQATESMLDLSQKMGMDVSSAAIMLGKALNDPIAGVGALRRVGVALTDQQEEQIKKFVELGDVESAQKIILGELQVEIGGAARAAGDTFAGKLDILKNKFGDIQESIGGAMIPGLTTLANKLIETLNQPEVQAAIKSISDWLAKELPKAIETASKILGGLSEGGIPGVLKRAQEWANSPEVKAALQAVGFQVGNGITNGIKFVLENPETSRQMINGFGQTFMNIVSSSGQIWGALGGAIGAGILLGIYESLTGRKLTPEQAKAFNSVVMAGAQNAMAFMFPQRQGGGSVLGGQPYIVGERGPELFVPGSTGMIMPNGPGMPSPIGPGMPSPGGIGGDTFIIHLTYAPVFSLADAREAQEKLQPFIEEGIRRARAKRV